MAKKQNRKGRRARAVEPSQAVTDVSPEIVTTTQSQKHPSYVRQTPSQIPLTSRVIKEFNRENRKQPSQPPPPPPLLPPTTAIVTRRLGEFAKLGGPDLSDIRGYPHPAIRHHPQAMRMDQTTKSSSQAVHSYLATSRRTTAYNLKFDKQLDKFGITDPSWEPRGVDLGSITAALAIQRPTFSLSTFSEENYGKFRRNILLARNEDEVKACIIPVLMEGYPKEHFALNALFGGLEPLINDTFSKAQPDLYCGSFHKDTLDDEILQDLAGHIETSSKGTNPIVPNFFLEIKGPYGNGRVATSQGRYCGALGARAIHSLQNYGKEAPEYDNHPYTYSATYHDTTLRIFAHHITSPTKDKLPRYDMTHVQSIDLINNRQSFVDGVTAFRNARDLVKKYRDVFIAAANSRNRNPQDSDSQNKSDVGDAPPHGIASNSVPTLSTTYSEQDWGKSKETTILVDTSAAKTPQRPAPAPAPATRQVLKRPRETQDESSQPSIKRTRDGNT